MQNSPDSLSLDNREEQSANKTKSGFDKWQIAHLAYKNDCPDIAKRLGACGTDKMVLRRPDGTIYARTMPCGHRLCPDCAKEKTEQLRDRIKPLQDKAKTFLTLTIPTVDDDCLLGGYVDLLLQAVKDMHHRKGGRSDRWYPFGDGFIWKLEVTDSKKCFHPHLHVLSTEKFIPQKPLQKRWFEALIRAHNQLWKKYEKNAYEVEIFGSIEIMNDSPEPAPLVGGQRSFVWTRRVDQKAFLEMSKYLSKSIGNIPAYRWRALCDGLHRRRVYGSGGTLKMAPLQVGGAGYELLGWYNTLIRQVHTGDTLYLEDDLIEFIEKSEGKKENE